MLITAIEKRRKMLSALFLDGEFAVNIDTETLLQFRYKIGMDITDEQLHELILASDARRANEKALYLLEHRSHSKKELIEKIQRTTSKEAARSAADRMEYFGLVNDEAFVVLDRDPLAVQGLVTGDFAGRRAHPTGEVRQVIGLGQPLEGRPVLCLGDHVVPLRDQVVVGAATDRLAAGIKEANVAVGHPAVHAAGRLLASFFVG